MRNIFLAEDDEDDLLIFLDVILDLHPKINLIHAKDGEDLMSLLSGLTLIRNDDVLFLDLNMPRKNGYECLPEIRSNQKFQHLTVEIISTRFHNADVQRMLDQGANFYIHKLQVFPKFKKQVLEALAKDWFDSPLAAKVKKD